MVRQVNDKGIDPMQLCAPLSEQDLIAIYALRWQVLRAPWHQPVGSELDELEAGSWNLMVKDGEAVLATGRLHIGAPGVGHIRYMAVAPGQQGKGLGKLILNGLMALADSLGLAEVELNARDNALRFYQQAGFELLGPSHTLYGTIPHFKMRKSLAGSQAALARALTGTWHSTIPLAQFMGLEALAFNGEQLVCQAPFEANSNLHGTLFAGSHYALATLTAWGRIWWQLQLQGLEGDIVLAKGDIRYARPAKSAPRMFSLPVASWANLDKLRSGNKARIEVGAVVTEEKQCVSEFQGTFVVLPRH